MPLDSIPPGQSAILPATLARFADRIDRVDLYGSRARGTHRTGSDIDVVLIGDVDLDALLAIEAALDESELVLKVDLTTSNSLKGERFAGEVERDAVTLFTQADLAAAAPKRVGGPAGG